MLELALNSEFYAEWLADIEQSDAKDAFRYLVGLAASLNSLTCHPKYKGEVRSFYFMTSMNEQPFAFIPNKNWLLFYFRAPAIRSGLHSFSVLRSEFASANENSAGEWTVKLENISDVQRLWKIVAVE